jgi:hypothetical protein
MENLFELATLPASPFYSLRQLPCLKKRSDFTPNRVTCTNYLTNLCRPSSVFPKNAGNAGKLCCGKDGYQESYLQSHFMSNESLSKPCYKRFLKRFRSNSKDYN